MANNNKISKKMKNINKLTIEETYQKMTPHEHVLALPDTYIGGIEEDVHRMWVYDQENNKMIAKDIKYVPGLYKIFDEILVNARDHSVRDKTCNVIKITINQDTGEITCYNNGKNGIPVAIHKEYNIYVPELIFGVLLTSGNYKQTGKIVGGKNGVGGTCLAPETLIPLWNGKIKRADELTLDDKLIGDNGTIRNIKKIIRGTGQMYEISQTNGDSYKVNYNHILTLYMPNHKLIFWDYKQGWAVLWWNNDTKSINKKTVKVNNNSLNAQQIIKEFCKTIPDCNIFDICIQDYIKLNTFTKNMLKGIRGECVQWNKQDIPMDPYLFGISLGTQKNNEKYIPENYIINDSETRLNVLAGIIDSNDCNYYTNNNVEIYIHKYNEQLINDIMLLIRSLGFHCSFTTKDNFRRYINIVGNIKAIPIKHSKNKHENINIYASRSTGQIKIKNANNGDYIGIEIDDNHRFVMNDFTVTHNCANIYSTNFYIEVVDSARKLKYTQNFYDNMYKKEKPTITKLTKTNIKSYVMVKFIPDFKRFGITNLSDDHIALFQKRVYDIAACTDKKIKVYLNNKLINISSFEDYIKMFYDNETTDSENNKINVVFEEANTRWRVAAIYDPNNGYRHISYVNGICTFQGGSHVNHVMDQILKNVNEFIQKKHKGIKIKNAHIKDNLTIFIDSVIEDPSFSSQTKEFLTNKVASFGSRCDLSDIFINKLIKTGIVEEVVNFAKIKALVELKKTDGKKTKSVKGLVKLKDAHWAGTRKSKYCRLILTEGDSAKTFAIAGTEIIGRDKYGVFPLKGKMLNVRDASPKQLINNEEIKNIKHIIGLKQNKKYDDISELRYGGIIILTDQDSVTADTPLLLKFKDIINIKTIDNLSTQWEKNNNGKEYSYCNYQVWTDKGWTNINKIIRHKVTKKIFRVLTDTGVVDVTEDHSLLNFNNEKISPKQCEIGTLLLHSFPNTKNYNIPTNIDENEAYLAGLCYNKKNNKNIPIEILNGSANIRQHFFNGFYDSYKCSVNRNGSILFDIYGKIHAQEIYFLCRSLGFIVSINFKLEKPDIYTLVINVINKESQQLHPYKIKKIFDLGIQTQYVYDLETENHHFQAGVGQIIVHNTDGSHIKGLLINFVQFFWPSLIKKDGFIQSMATPIIKVWKGTDKKKQNPLIFYTQSEYLNWKEINKNNNWIIKYYKGLGTSKPEEAKECFIDFEKKLISYVWDNVNNKNNKNELPNSDDDFDKSSNSYKSITLAFAKNRANDRKQWLLNYDKNEYIENDLKLITYSDFIHKDLKHFSFYDVQRSIPSMCDGFKPSQRKILFGAFLRGIFKKEIKVVQLAGFISDKAAYHHGEESLHGAIVGMAQDFIGANNINLLLPNGNFGDREQGGKNYSSPRYIYTQLNELTPLIFRKEDECIYNYIDDDGMKVEPIHYAPIVPMILINGCSGIGTGFSTKIPCFNPTNIINNIKRLLNKQEPKFMYPWYKGFKGKITKLNDDTFQTAGIYEIIDNQTIIIQELPIGVWTETYISMLDNMVSDDPKNPKRGQIIKNYQDDSCGNNIDIKIVFLQGMLQKLLKNNNLATTMKLHKTIRISNMHLHIANGQIKKYSKINDILYDYFNHRLLIYDIRKKYHLQILKHELDIIKWKIKFLEYVITGKIIFFEKVGNKRVAKKETELINKLEQLKFPKMIINFNPNTKDDNISYDYLTKMQIISLTEEKLDNMKKLFEEKLVNYETYKNTDIEQLWLTELQQFEKLYLIWLQEQIVTNKNTKKRVKRRRKK